MNPRKTIHFVTLGCSKNLVDSEHLMRQVEFAGYKVDHNSENIRSGSVIVNTCGFIKDAKQESIDTILELAEAKSAGKIQNLFVIGCLSELYKDELAKEIPEVDQFFGAKNFDDILRTLGIGYQKDLINERVQTTPKHFAYLKISEGCNRSCAFCAIPAIRGAHISLPIETLVDEAKKLAKAGVKELIVIAQDITWYGLDIYKEQKLGDLLRQLETVDGIEWIRLHYAYPQQFPKDVIEAMKSSSKLCKYLDIPFQHISDRMLKHMRRGNNKEQTLKLIEALRTQMPDIAIRTTFLVGHPDETEDDFNQLIDFVREMRFERMGVFPYSHEEFSYAYSHYQDNIPEEIKTERVETLMDLQQRISEEINQTRIGKTYKVLIDRLEGDYYIGRTEYDSPEVDNEVLISATTNLKIGSFVDARITDATEFDLFGELV